MLPAGRCITTITISAGDAMISTRRLVPCLAAAFVLAGCTQLQPRPELPDDGEVRKIERTIEADAPAVPGRSSTNHAGPPTTLVQSSPPSSSSVKKLSTGRGAPCAVKGRLHGNRCQRPETACRKNIFRAVSKLCAADNSVRDRYQGGRVLYRYSTKYLSLAASSSEALP